jgi:cysteinyl-tRNA synthetase
MSTPIRLFNTLSRSQELLQPVQPDGIVRIYSCGPTVYNTAHIGNMRAFLFTDILQRTIRTVGGFDVRWVMNITDVDDKIIRDSAVGSTAWPAALGEQSHDAMDNMRRFTEWYEQMFVADIEALGIKREHFFAMPRATNYIPHMQDMIRGIVAAGYGYVSEGSVYFSVSAFRRHHTYGRLYSIDAEHFREGVRIDADEYERDSVSDFVLWKGRKPGEPYWEFVIDGGELPGRPGWHIECSAMSKELLGLPFDIHTGGVDLRFPHHEDELAQCTACDGEHGKEFTQARLWVHNEFLEVEGRKMSKSLNNFFTVGDLRQRGLDPLDVRFALISAHYRSVLNFTFDGVAAAGKARQRIQQVIWDLVDVAGDVPASSVPEGVAAALADDLNVPRATAALHEFVASIPANPTLAQATTALGHLRAANQVYALWTFTPRPTITIPSDVATLAAQRWDARLAKNWSEADRLRTELAQRGWQMKDGKDSYTIEPL